MLIIFSFSNQAEKLELLRDKLESVKLAVATNLMSELQISFLRIGKLNVESI